MEIKLDGLDPLLKHLDKFQRQIPYVVARSLTKTAESARGAIMDHIKSEFIVRTPWVRKGYPGIGLKTASKTDLRAEVFSHPDWMELHEPGGTKKARGTGLIAVPMEAAQPDERRKIAPSKRPKALKTAGKSFIIQTKSGPMIFTRKGRKKQKKLIPMYTLEKSVRIERRYRFALTGLAQIERVYMKIFQDSIEHAIRTAR
jgi:hypothetical protein